MQLDMFILFLLVVDEMKSQQEPDQPPARTITHGRATVQSTYVTGIG